MGRIVGSLFSIHLTMEMPRALNAFLSIARSGVYPASSAQAPEKMRLQSGVILRW